MIPEHEKHPVRYMRRWGQGSYWRDECVPNCPACSYWAARKLERERGRE